MALLAIADERVERDPFIDNRHAPALSGDAGAGRT